MSGAADRPIAPAGLGAAGLDLWDRFTSLVRVEQGHERPIRFSASELLTLGLACRQADDIAALEAALTSDGVVVIGSKGQAKLSGVPSELRLQRAALARLVGMLQVPEDGQERAVSPASRRAQRAADARWSRQAAEREARGRGA